MGLVSMGHNISIPTNLSASKTRLMSFLEASRGALNVFSASLHLEYATPESILHSYETIRPYEAFGLSFHVTSVGLPEAYRRLHKRLSTG